MGLRTGSYIVVAYTPHALSPGDLESIPRGSVVVGLAALEKLLRPLGALPLLQQLRSLASDVSDSDESDSD